MIKTFSIIKKNIKLIARSRISALIIIFGPLLIMLIVGLAFSNTDSPRINVGYYTPGYNNLTGSFVEVLQKSYQVTNYDSLQECSQAILAGEIHICVMFPEDFQISNERVNEITFLVDNSKINFFETVVDSIEADFNERALQLTMGMTKELLSKLNETQESIADKSSVISLMKIENTELKSDVDRISSEVGGLELDFDYSDMGISDLEDQSDEITDVLKDVKNIADDAIDEAENLIEELTAEINAQNISGASSLFDMMNDTAEELEDLKDDLNQSESLNTSKLENLIGSLKTDLHDVENKFEDASDARDTAVEKIKNINERLEASLSKILIVEETFDLIVSSIEGTAVTDLESITKPISKKVQPVVTEENQLNFFFPYLIVLIIMFIGILLSSTLAIMEKTSQAYFRNFVTPTSDLTFVFGSYVTTLMIMALQMFVVLAISSIYLHSDITNNFSSTIVVLLLLITLFSWMGMSIGNLFNTEETSTLASVSIASLLLFISDLIFPLERMSDTVAYLARTYNPFVIGTELLRKTMVLRIPIGEVGNDLYLMVSYLAMFFTLMMVSYKLSKRSYLLRWGGYIARRELRLEKQTKELDKLLDKYRNIEEKDYFTTKEGKKISSFREILEYAAAIGDEKYKEYVNDNENLFADWIENILDNEIVALKMRTAKNRKNMQKAMHKGLEFYEKLLKKIEKHKGNKPELVTEK